jgi:hypothetical protein
MLSAFFFIKDLGFMIKDFAIKAIDVIANCQMPNTKPSRTVVSFSMDLVANSEWIC